MKNKKIASLIRISIPILIPVIIIGACFGLDKIISVKAEDFSSKPVVVNKDKSLLSITDDNPLEIVSKKSYGNVEGFSQNFGFIGDDALVGIGMDRKEFYKKYPNDKNKPDENGKINQNAINDISGKLYRLNLTTLEKKTLDIDTRSILSDFVPNGNKISYVNDNNYSIYDLKNNTNSIYKKANIKDELENAGNWSKDGNYLISYDNGDLDLYSVKGKFSKKLKVKSDNLWIQTTSGFYSDDGENIYFIGEQSKNGHKDLRYQRLGLFKINSSSGKIQEVFVSAYSDLQNSDNSKIGCIVNDYCVLDGGKKILLNAIIEGEAGDYMYDVNNKKFYNVVKHTVKSKEGLYGSSIWVSPDKTKVIYMNLSLENNKEQWNLYAAKINGNSLTSKICVSKDINILGSLGTSIQWSGDSKKILFLTGKKAIEKNNYTFYDENQVNIISFK